MTDPSSVASRSMPPAMPVSPLTHDGPDASSVLKVARATKANVLIVGPDPEVTALVRLLADGGSDSIARGKDGLLMLPPAATAGTAILRNVDGLTPEEQRRLLYWLDCDRRRTQVVSTASIRLAPLVAAGAFDDKLYYRLNTTHIDLFD